MKTRKLQNSKFIRQETIQPDTHRIAKSEILGAQNSYTET